MTDKKVGIIGGCGHVGIPLGLVLADNGCRVTLIDINQNAVDKINSHELPFLEEGAEAVLRRCGGKSLFATTDIQEVCKQDVIIFVVGTPVDEHLSPKINDVLNVIKAYMPFLRKNQLIVLRSTVFPGVTAVVYDLLLQHFENPKLALCREKVFGNFTPCRRLCPVSAKRLLPRLRIFFLRFRRKLFIWNHRKPNLPN